MTEFGEEEILPELSINLPIDTFFAVLSHTVTEVSDELAYAVYNECLEEEVADEVTEEERLYKYSTLHERSGDIELRRGDYVLALASYTAARTIDEQLPDPIVIATLKHLL